MTQTNEEEQRGLRRRLFLPFKKTLGQKFPGNLLEVFGINEVKRWSSHRMKIYRRKMFKNHPENKKSTVELSIFKCDKCDKCDSGCVRVESTETDLRHRGAQRKHRVCFQSFTSIRQRKRYQSYCFVQFFLSNVVFTSVSELWIKRQKSELWYATLNENVWKSLWVVFLKWSQMFPSEISFHRWRFIASLWGRQENMTTNPMMPHCFPEFSLFWLRVSVWSHTNVHLSRTTWTQHKKLQSEKTFVSSRWDFSLKQPNDSMTRRLAQTDEGHVTGSYYELRSVSWSFDPQKIHHSFMNCVNIKGGCVRTSLPRVHFTWCQQRLFS